MRVEAIEDLSTLGAEQEELLDSLLGAASAVKPGTAIVCTGGVSVVQQVSFDPDTPDVELSAAAGIEPCDLDL